MAPNWTLCTRAFRDEVAYGIYFNNSARTTFNFGAGNHRYYSFAADQGPLDYILIYGPSVPQVVERYTELTGRMPMPPKWALGYQQSRWSYTPAAEVLRIARTFREKRIPADVIYLSCVTTSTTYPRGCSGCGCMTSAPRPGP